MGTTHLVSLRRAGRASIIVTIVMAMAPLARAGQGMALGRGRMMMGDAAHMGDMRQGGIKSRDTWQSGAPFGEGNMFGIVTPIDKFATDDMPPLALRVLGDGPGRAYGDKLAAMTVARRTFAVQDRGELSMPPAPNAKFVAAILADVTIVSGHAAQYEAYLKDDLLPLLKKDNTVGFVVSRTVFGGNANEYHEVTYLASFADIDKGPAQVRLLNAAERTAMAAKITPHVAHVERTILRHMPDLSYAPKPGS